MKKIFSLIIILLLMISLTSCFPRRNRNVTTVPAQSSGNVSDGNTVNSVNSDNNNEVFTTEPQTETGNNTEAVNVAPAETVASDRVLKNISFNTEADIFSVLGQNISQIDTETAFSEQETTPGKVYTFTDNSGELSWSISTCQDLIYQLGLYNIPTNQNLMIKNNLIMNLSEVAMLQSFGSPKSQDSSFIENATDGSKNFNRLLYEFDFSNEALPGYTAMFLTYKDIERTRPWGVSFQNLDVCN